MSKPYYRTHFESLGDFIKASQQPSLSSADSSRREGREGEFFTGVRTFADAVKMAERGWASGRPEKTNDRDGGGTIHPIVYTVYRDGCGGGLSHRSAGCCW